MQPLDSAHSDRLEVTILTQKQITTWKKRHTERRRGHLMLNTVYTPQIGRRQQPRGLCLVYPSARRAQVALCHLCWHFEQDHVFSKVKDAWAQPPSPTICKSPRVPGHRASRGTLSRQQGALRVVQHSVKGLKGHKAERGRYK